MATLLHIDASGRGEESVSRQLSKAFVAEWKQKNADGKVLRRDLAKSNITFVDPIWIQGAFSSPEQHSPEHKQVLGLSDKLIAELHQADEYVIGTPMYNFNVPATLKAWIDQVVRAGKTFKMQSGGGFSGLLTGKRVTVLIASGGAYPAGSPFEAYNFETPYLRGILGFMGLTDVRFVHAFATNDLTMGKVSAEQYLAPHLAEVRKAANVSA